MSDEKTPVKVSTAKEGDRVVVRHWVGYGQTSTPRLSLRTVSKASKMHLVVYGTSFRRDGVTMEKRNNSRLLDPTPEVLAELQTWLDKDAAEARARQEAEQRHREDRDRRAKIAAGWLAAARDPDAIFALFSQQVLNDVYDELVTKRQLAEAPDAQAHAAPV